MKISFGNSRGQSSIFVALISALILAVTLALVFAFAPVIQVQSLNRAISIVEINGYTVLAGTEETLSSNLIPSADNTYDLGSATNKWRELYLTGTTIHLGDVTIEAIGNALKIGDKLVPTLPSGGVKGQVLSLDAVGEPIWSSVTGTQGENGESAYQLAVDNGFIGTESEWLDSLVGVQGVQGEQGVAGYTPIKGIDYFDGIQGIQGVAGAKGDTGATGAQGLQGIQGEIGLTGVKGDKGDTGSQGLQGIQGIQGVKGDIGENGYTPIKGVDYFDGSQGIQGIQGEIGLTGAKGDTGSQGIQGIQGETGTIGLTGQQGIQGIQGETGIQGLKGDKGDNGISSISASTATNLTGILTGSGSTVGYTANNSANWDTAYGWGNHANAGYLTANQSITLGGDLSGSGAISITATVSGLSGKALPTLATGFLKYSGSAWTFDNSTYLTSYTETDPIVKAINGVVKSNGTTIAVSGSADIISALGYTPENTANKAAASGYAGLGANSLVPTAQLGSGTANSTTFLRGDQTYAVPSTGTDLYYYRHYGVTTYEAWYNAPPRSGTALAGSALTINRLYAVPFITPKAITLDCIGVYVSTLGASAHGRLGIYSDAGGASTNYPGSLVLDCGVIDASSTGAKKITINQVLAANTLYWFVYVCDVAHSIYCVPVAGVINILGTSSALGTAQNAGLYASFTYAALPSTYPAFTAMITAAPIPCIFVRLSN